MGAGEAGACAPPAGPVRHGAEPRPDHRRRLRTPARGRGRRRSAPRSRDRIAARRRGVVATPGDAPARGDAVAGVAPPMRFTVDVGELAVVLELDTEPAEVTFAKIRDNLDLERWFRLPKSHERRIHGHRHAGVRIVQDGPTLVHALDAHVSHPELFTVDDFLPYRAARPPTSQIEAVSRRKIMRKARSKKNRPILLAELERRYRESPVF